MPRWQRGIALLGLIIRFGNAFYDTNNILSMTSNVYPQINALMQSE